MRTEIDRMSLDLVLRVDPSVPVLIVWDGAFYNLENGVHRRDVEATFETATAATPRQWANSGFRTDAEVVFFTEDPTEEEKAAIKAMTPAQRIAKQIEWSKAKENQFDIKELNTTLANYGLGNKLKVGRNDEAYVGFALSTSDYARSQLLGREKALQFWDLILEAKKRLTELTTTKNEVNNRVANAVINNSTTPF